MASGRPVAVFVKDTARVLKQFTAIPRLAGVTPASRLAARPSPERVPSGIQEIDALTGGFPRGCLSEICGSASSGRTSVLVAALAAATRREEVCAVVDTTDALDVASAVAAGVDLERLLWVRCGPRTSDARGLRSKVRDPGSEVRSPRSEVRLEQALRVTDLLLQSGGFGLVVMDLGDVPHTVARRVPLASWFRFQRGVEPTSTVLLVVARAPCAPTCAALRIRLQPGKKLSAFSSQFTSKNEPAHTQLLDGLHIEGELLRSRMERKPAQSVAFATRRVRTA